jgi:hypothetical protein
MREGRGSIGKGDEMSQRPKHPASGIFWAMWLSGRSRALGDSDLAAADKRHPRNRLLGRIRQSTLVLSSKIAPAMLCIPPSTSQRLHLARRCLFQGSQPQLGKLPCRRRAFVRVSLFCASLGASRGPWKRWIPFQGSPRIQILQHHASSTSHRINQEK